VRACSYFYEMCNMACSWDSDPLKDSDGDGVTTWCEVKLDQLRNGDAWNGGKPYDETAFPIIRCFHHRRDARVRCRNPQTGQEILELRDIGMVLNVAYAGNVFKSAVIWEYEVIE